MLLAFLGAGSARATDYTVTLSPDQTVTKDCFIVEDQPNQQTGGKSILDLEGLAGKSRRILVDMPVMTLASYTVTSAELSLIFKTASPGTAAGMSRIWPLAQSWYEPEATWPLRQIGQPWTTAGGTLARTWADRLPFANSLAGDPWTWQVGPIVSAWNLGDLAENGFVIDAIGTTNRIATFYTSENLIASLRPRLAVHFTDEPPAIHAGTAELQPPAVLANATNTPLVAWLELDATSATNTGVPTGPNQLVLEHGGAIRVTGVDSVVVAGTRLPSSKVAFTDSSAFATFWFPNLRVRGRVAVYFRASVPLSTSGSVSDLRMRLDDSTTPGAGPQYLWPGNADGVEGNGDSWVLAASASPPTRIVFMPDTASVVNYQCTQLSVFAIDAQGNRYLEPSQTMTVLPPVGGNSVTNSGLFCAATVGRAMVVATAQSGTLSDTAYVNVTPSGPPAIRKIDLEQLSGGTITAFAPGDTVLVDVGIEDPDGFQQVEQVGLSLSLAGHEADFSAPAFRAAIQWQRTPASSFSVTDPVGSSWRVVPPLCAVDTTANSLGIHKVRFALRVGDLARASGAGLWAARARATAALVPTTAALTLSGLAVTPRVLITAADSSGSFSAGLPGASGQPLASPASGALRVSVVGNTDLLVRAAVSPLVGVHQPFEVIPVAAPAQSIAWSSSGTSTSARLDTAFTLIAPLIPAQTSEGGETVPLYLWVDHPAGISSQPYLGALRWQARDTGGTDSAGVEVPLSALVAGTGLAAVSARAEVSPVTVQAGTPSQRLDVYVRPQFGPTSTGINRLMVSVPDSYKVPVVKQVLAGGTSLAFTDGSRVGVADVMLKGSISTTTLIDVQLELNVPTTMDTLGSDFVVQYADTATTVPPQSAIQGDADGIANANSWRVAIHPGPLAALQVTPVVATCRVDSTIVFTAKGSDTMGNAIAPMAAWSVTPGIGLIDPASGAFTAFASGRGTVTAVVGSLIATAAITTRPARGLESRVVSGPAVVRQGQSSATFTLDVENVGNAIVDVDTARLVFSRAFVNDATRDFDVVPSAANPPSLAAGERAQFAFAVSVDPGALVAPLSVGARVSGIERGTLVRLSDALPDTAFALDVVPGGVAVSATRSVSLVSPGGPAVGVLALRTDNLSPAPVTLRTLKLSNLTSGPGTQAQRDAEIGEIGLYRDDGDRVFESANDTLLLRTTAANGSVAFGPIGAVIPGSSSATFLLAMNPPLFARDGDLVDLSLEGPGSVDFVESGTVARASWPVLATPPVRIDGMSAAQVALTPAPGGPLNPGQVRQLALDLRLPANGYESDVLEHLGVYNAGDATDGGDLAKVEAWVDDANDVFDPLRDRLLGRMTFTGNRWEISQLALTVPVGGLHVYVTVDGDPAATEGRSVRLGLPASPDVGVVMRSGNSGPLDRVVINPFTLTLSDNDRVVLTTLAVDTGSVTPGTHGAMLLHFSAVNNYTSDRSLTSLSLANVTSGPGTRSQLDAEMRGVALHLDGNGDGLLDDPSADPILGTGFFVNGQLSFTGLGVPLPAGRGAQFFVTADVSLAGAADGDGLQVALAGGDAVEFDQPTAAVGAWPVNGGRPRVVDGFTRGQMPAYPVTNSSVSPGDGPLLALNISVPGNGYRADLLQSVRVVNRGTALPADLSRMDLWRDRGDGVFDAGAGDDQNLGPLSGVDSTWRSPLLSVSMPVPGLRLFVSVVVAAGAREDATVHLAVPVLGVVNTSGNSGPLDAALESDGTMRISNSPLAASLHMPGASTLGGVVPVRLVLRNRGTEPISTIVPSALSLSGSGAMTLVSGPTPVQITLAPAQVDSFTWNYQAASVGDVHLEGDALGTGVVSGLSRRAPLTSTNSHRIFTQAAHLDLYPTVTLPGSVNQGQEVVPLNLTFSNPGGADASDVRLDRLSLRFEDDQGAGLVPSQLLSRVEVREGETVYLVKTGLETSGASVDLSLANAALVSGTQPTTLTIALTLASTTATPLFRVSVVDASACAATDATNGSPVATRLANGTFPVTTGVARIVAEATRVDVRPAAGPLARVSLGASAVPALDLQLVSPGVPGVTSDARLSFLALSLEDSTGVRLAQPGQLLRRVSVRSGAQTVASLAVTPLGDSILTIGMTPAVNLPAGMAEPLQFSLALTDSAPVGRYRLRLEDSLSFVARDANTHARVPAVYAATPARGPWLAVESPVHAVAAAGVGRMPSQVVVGETGVPALHVTLRHPGAPGSARVRLDSVSVHCRDDQHHLLVPSSMLQRLSVLWNGVEVGAITNLPRSGKLVVVPLPGLTVDPSDSAGMEIAFDVNPTTGGGGLEFMLDAGDFAAVDANSGTPLTVGAESGFAMPLFSGVGRVLVSARELAAGMTSRMPVGIAADGTPVDVAELQFSNLGDPGSGSILLDHLVVHAADRLMRSFAIGEAAVRVEAWVAGARWGESAALTSDSTTAAVVGGSRLALAAGVPTRVVLRLVPRPGTTATSVRLGLDRADIGVVQPASTLLAIAVRPQDGQVFPLWTEAAGFAPRTLAESYSNYPNPFGAGRQATTLAYYLPAPARVTLRILTPAGAGVMTLLDGAPLGAGLHESDRWDGRNGRGEAVYNGVYVAELDVRFDDGRHERVLRKVAVVR